MAWRFHGRARVDPTAPVSFAICDRCNALYNITDLQWQYQWAGPNLQNLRLLVCQRCLDVPQPQLKPRILPPDPMPTLNARVERYVYDDVDWFEDDTGDYLTTQDDTQLIEQNVANNRQSVAESEEGGN